MATTSKTGGRQRPAADPPETADTAPVDRERTAIWPVDARTAARRIRGCAATCAAAESRGVLHALARATRRGIRRPARAVALVAAVEACLELGGSGPDRWWIDEAAAWALARLVRACRRPEAGRHLERLVAEARVGAAALAERDTRPARFILVLARLFADVEACREFEATAAAAVEEEIHRLVTADGAVVVGGSAAGVDRIERWTSVRAALRGRGGRGWSTEVERRWRAAAAWGLGLLGPRGRQPTDGQAPRDPAAFVTAIEDAGDRRARRTARVVGRARRGAVGRRGLLPTDRHDAAAAAALIRTDWGPDAVRVLVEWRDAAPRLEVVAGGRPLVSGDWEWQVEADGRGLDAEGAWTVTGWESDRKAAFLEIAAPLAGGMRLERQVVVLRRQRIVLCADAVVPAAGPDGAPVAEIDHRMALPLAGELAAEPAAETREVLVYDSEMRLLALPPALPEWRTAGRGDLAVADGRLVLAQAGHRRLYAPLWLDCDPRRIGRPLTWRQLTVADTRRNLPAHQAAGFRVQSGAEQWLLYRALDAPRNRTLLGCNVSSGFLLGRVRRSGEVARTVEID